MKGLEPPRREAPDPKSGAATNYATSAFLGLFGLQNYAFLSDYKMKKEYFTVDDKYVRLYATPQFYSRSFFWFAVSQIKAFDRYNEDFSDRPMPHNNLYSQSLDHLW